ncbi:MAG TPA: FAD-dependent oxidoreductase [Rhizomicrobium sp.]|nr:FAD-dependent oxidoreductase [Rhizomicrobium sp.]
MSAESFDVVVIGAGIAGASAASHLARTLKVAMLEREEFPGYHSTGRSAALFSESYGNAAVRALSRASRDFFYAPPAGFSEHALVKPRGAMHVARADRMQSLERFAAASDMAGSILRVQGDEARGLCPILKPEAAVAGVLETDAADVDVDALHQGYLRAFRAAGGRLVTHAEVRALARRAGQWHVETGAGTFRAPIAINAAGAWADTVAAMAGAAPLAIQPCRRTAVLVELPKDMDASRWPMVIDIDETFYMKPDAGLLLISPADETPVAPCDAQPEELDIAIAIDRVEQATTLRIRSLRKRWAGLRSFAPDRSPAIGFDPHAQGFFWLAGQGGYGIQTAPAASRLAAALVRGDALAPDLAAVPDLSPSRFGTRTRSRA